MLMIPATFLEVSYLVAGKNYYSFWKVTGPDQFKKRGGKKEGKNEFLVLTSTEGRTVT